MRQEIVPQSRVRSRVAGAGALKRFAALAILTAALLTPGGPARGQDVPEVVFGYPGGGGDVGQYGKIIHDGLGRLHAAYYDALNGDLKYALGIRNPTTGLIAWTIQVVDFEGDVGLYCDLAEGIGYVPVISYHDATNRTLKLAYDRNADGDFEQDQPIFGVDPSNGFPEIRTVDDTTAITGLYTSVAADSAANVYISYQDGVAGQLRFAFVNDFLLTREAIDTSSDRTGRFSAIALDNNFPATPTVFYQNETDLDLYGATRFPTGWNGLSARGFQRRIDGAGDTGYHIDAAYNTGHDMWYVSYQDSVSTSTAIADLKLAVLDDANVSYSIARIATCFDEIVIPCEFQNPIGDYGYFTSIAFDSNERARVAHYSDALGDLYIDRRIVQGVGGSVAVYDEWEYRALSERSGDMGRFTSISHFDYPAIPGPGTDEIMHVGFYDASRRAMRLTDITNDTPAFETAGYIDGAKAGEYSSVAEDSTGTPIAAYYDDVQGALYIARRGGPASAPWEAPILIDDSTAARLADPLDSDADNDPRTNEPDFQQTGQGVSMVADTTDTLHLAYFDRLRRKINYATYSFSSGTTYRTLDAGSFRGEYLSQAVAPDGSLYAVAYYKEQNPSVGADGPALLVATGDGFDTWTIDTVDTAGDVGKHCSVAIDSARTVHVAYHDATSLNLKYAFRPVGLVWSVENVTDTLSPDGIDTSIAINPQTGEPAISFYDQAEAALKFSQLTSDGWETVTVDDIGDVGLQSKLVFDPAINQTAIVYHDGTNGTLKVAARRTSSVDLLWPVTRSIDTGGVGVNPAAAPSTAGRLHVTYFDQTAGDLKYLGFNVPNLNSAEPAWRAYR